MAVSVLGVRCSNTDFTFAVLSGTKKKPAVTSVQTHPFPKGFSQGQRLVWLYHEVEELVKTHQIKKVCLRRSESRTAARQLETRIEHEAAVILAAASTGMKAIFKKVRSTIAKDLGQKGRSKYLQAVDTSVIKGFDKLSSKQKDAVLSGWSELP